MSDRAEIDVEDIELKMLTDSGLSRAAAFEIMRARDQRAMAVEDEIVTDPAAFSRRLVRIAHGHLADEFPGHYPELF